VKCESIIITTLGCDDDDGNEKCKPGQTAQWKGTIVYLINLERIQGIDRLYVWIINARLTEVCLV
jgi:hypothetical protein